jgi:hypothetical protein
MSRREDHHDNLPRSRDDILAELSRPVPAPDLTRSIMGRLGYMRVDAAVARRHRIRRWAGRTAVLAMMLLTIVGGIAIFNQSEAVRRPHEMTLPAAIGQDFELHQQRFNTFIRVLQSSTPHHESTHLSPFLPVSADESDVLLLPADSEGSEEHEFGEDERFDEPEYESIDDVEYPAIAPVRWV